MADRYEYYITGDDTGLWCQLAVWQGQTFTPVTAHKITSVKLLLYRVGSPKNVTASIQGVDENHYPDGSDICSGTTDGDTLTTNTAGEWREITLGAGANLDADTMYAIVVRALEGDTSNYCVWRCDKTDATYDVGRREYSDNSGSTWTHYITWDALFEDWGEPAFVLHEWEGSDSIAIGEALVKTPMKMLVDGIQFSDVTIKEFYKVLTDPIAFTDTLVSVYTHVRTFVDGIAFTDVVYKLFEKVFTDGIKFTDCLTRWRWLAAIRNLTKRRCVQPSIREQDVVDDGNIGNV